MIKWLPGALLLTLVLVLFFQWKDWPPGPSRVGLDEPRSADVGVTLDSELNPAEHLTPSDPKDAHASVIDRPLFRPERRPPDPELASQEGTTEPDLATSLEGMDLSAVIITPSLVSAWVMDPSQPRPRRLRIGDDLEGWSVQTILPDRVLLERQGVQDALILRDYSKISSSDRPRPLPRRMPQGRQPVEPSDDDLQDE
jgi:general secretion pathway protein N